MSRSLKLTERIEEAHSPANNLALAMAFSGVGILNTLMSLILGGLAYTFGFLLYQLSAEPLLKAWGPQRLQLVNAPAEARNRQNARGYRGCRAPG